MRWINTSNQKEVEALLTEIDEIVQFTLQIYEVRAKWRAICLPYDRWRKLSTERALMDQIALRSIDNLIKALATEEGQSELKWDDALREKIRTLIQMEKEIGKEYGEDLSLDAYLSSDAMCVVVKAYLEPPLAPKKLRQKCALIYRLVGQNKDVDFLILLNLSTASRNSRRENLMTTVHEVLHYVQSLSESRSSFESIESQSEGIVNQFLENKEF